MEIKEAVVKAAEICSSSEKCAFDIEKKLRAWDVSPDDYGAVIDYLKKEKYIDHQRYARFFVRDKFRFNKWGRIKIRYELMRRGIENDIADDALEAVDAEAYIETLDDLLKSRLRQLKQPDKYAQKAALLRFAASRGFEADVCYSRIDILLKGKR
jgi:regulatory protein